MNSNIEEIKNRINIVDFIREYLNLHKSGSSWRGICPFHHEKSPSFFVSEEKQIWHCFGCGKGGDVFGFLSAMEGLEFPEALRVLAKRTGIELGPRNPELENKRTRMLDALKRAAEFFSDNLQKYPQAQEYFQARGLASETLEEWQLGFSAPEWENLFSFLKSKGFSDDEVFQAGLSIKKDRGTGYYDRFRNRLMFPIRDIHGNVVGFTGRKLSEDDTGGKYVNSPQTLLYDKSSVLFGLDKAKQHIKKLGAVLIMEGNMDAITAHQYGWKNAVASSGTALTEIQMKLLKRYTENIIFAFDMDSAGFEATKRGVDRALEYQMNVKVLELPAAYKDPDECLQKDPEAFKKAVREARNVLDYYFDRFLQDLDLKKVDDKKKAAQRLLPILSKVKNSIEQMHYLQTLAERIRVPIALLQEKIDPLPRDNKSSPKVSDAVAKYPPEHILSERALALLLLAPEEAGYYAEHLSPEALHEDFQDLYRKIINFYNQNQHFECQFFLNAYPEEKERIDVLSLYAESQKQAWESVKREILSTLQLLLKYFFRRRLAEIEQDIRQAETGGDASKVNELISELNIVIQKLRTLEPS